MSIPTCARHLTWSLLFRRFSYSASLIADGQNCIGFVTAFPFLRKTEKLKEVNEYNYSNPT
jgi:hypothetical protein